MERRDWVLLALRNSGTTGLSPVQLQKSLFLLGAKLPNEVGDDFYHFVPHNYGPFSREIYGDAGTLADDGLVAIEQKRSSFPEYFITDAGANRLTQIADQPSPRAVQYLERVVDWAKALSFPALVRAIYQEYPAFRINSVFREF